MSLATRCTACNTVFRVVQDQLKVSEGWVRCGRCHEVFNALDTLFDLERAASASAEAPTADDVRGPTESGGATDAPAAALPGVWAPQAEAPPAPDQAPIDALAGAAAQPDAAPAAGVAMPASEPESEPAPEPEPAPESEPAGASLAAPGAPCEPAPEARAEAPAEPLPADAPVSAGRLAGAGFHALARVAAPLEAPPDTGFGPPSGAAHDDPGARYAPVVGDDTPASRTDARDRLDFADARFNSALLAEEGIAVPDDVRDEEAAAAAATHGEAAPGATPEFLRRAERRARWNRPGVRIVMALSCALLLLVLAAQTAHHYRDLAAARWPAARPALAAMCEAAGCRIEALRRIDDIVIESSALTGAPAGDAVRLAVVLRNRGALPLAMPAIELTLTDAGGQMLARRALSPADFGVGDATLPAAGEAPLQLVLAVSGRRPSGYTVEPFYP